MAGRLLTIHCVPNSEADLRTAAGPLAPGTAHIWYTTIADGERYAERYEGFLDDIELARAERFRFAADRMRYVVGHGMLRRILGHYLRTPPATVRMERGPHGKPYLESGRLFFNMSDTKDAVMVAVAPDQEIGADIETMARSVDHGAVAQHYFTPEEVTWIMDGKPARLGKRRFLELWTRKEAVLKASGVGIMEDLRVLRVDAPRNTNTITHPEFVRMAAPQYHVRTWRLGREHVVSLATGTSLNDVHFLDIGALPQAGPDILTPRPRTGGGN